MSGNYLKYQEKIDSLTLEQKVQMLSGANFWNTKKFEKAGIKSIMLTDGPHGIRKQGGNADHLGLNASIPATCFPTAATVANSWDVDLLREMGEYLSVEAVHEGISVVLGPGLNIKRNPLGGRNFEYYSEDPFLSGTLAANFISGLESTGISSCPKHFAVNSQENLRMTINEVVDKRALHEIYLEGFRLALKAKPKAIMTAYNKVNGVYANENHYLLDDILKKKFKFDGVIITDWGGNNDRIAALKSGNQLEMPYSGGSADQAIKNAVLTEEISKEELDNAVADLINLSEITNHALEEKSAEVEKKFNKEKHHQKAIEIAEQSIVLLKNEAILPVAKTKNISLIGDFAFKPRYQGAGSSLIEPTVLKSSVDIFENSSYKITGVAKGFKRFGHKSKKLLNEAVELARNSEVVLFYMGLDEAKETEGLDRKTIDISANQIEVLKAISEVNENIIIIISGGAVVNLNFDQYAKALITTYLSGQGAAEAILSVICGKVNPSGKLAETYPQKLTDILSNKYYPGRELTAEHRESIFVGYRYFSTANIDVKYPFGFGLSYTTFEYSDLKVNENSILCKVKNTGEVKGKEIVQLYIKALESQIFRAEKELKGFVKVELEPGESKEVEILFEDNTFKYYNYKLDKFVTEKINYEIQIASDVQTVKLSEIINYSKIARAEQEEQQIDELYDKEKLSDYYNLKDEIRVEQFEELYGEKLPTANWDKKQELTLNDTILQLQNRKFRGKIIYEILVLANKILLALKKPIIANYVYFIIYLPFRQISRFTNGKISEKKVRKFLKKV